MPELLTATGLTRVFLTGKRRVEVLRGCSLGLDAGESLSVLGASGSGKSTLLHLLGTLDQPDAGELRFDSLDLLETSTRERSAFRRRELGFIFQFHHLLPEFSAEENVALPALIGKTGRKAAFDEARTLLESVGLNSRRDHRPGELSGGEQQRVAVARALMGEPRLLLADEPTGNLDARTGREVAELLISLCRKRNAGLVIVTHDRELADRADRSLVLEAGSLENA